MAHSLDVPRATLFNSVPVFPGKYSGSSTVASKGFDMRKTAEKALPICAVALGLALTGGNAYAANPLGGLTVAVSPKGNQLVAGGDNRVLYVLDPETLAVKQRLSMGAPILKMGFDASGDTLGVIDNDGTLHLIGTKDWKTRNKFNNKRQAVFSPMQGLIASADSEGRAKAIVVNAVADGREVFRAALQTPMPVAALGISPDGARLVALLGGNEDKDEPKVAYNDIPKDLKGVQRADFQQKGDGRTSLIQVYDLKTGKLVSESKTFFSMGSNQPVAAFIKGGVVFNEYGNVGFQITEDGKGRTIQFDGSFLYGSGKSHDGEFVMTGTLRRFTILKVGSMTASAGEPEVLAGTTNSVDQLPGWPEYFKGFDAAANAQVFYGATSGYRVVMFDASGKVLRSEPIF